LYGMCYDRKINFKEGGDDMQHQGTVRIETERLILRRFVPEDVEAAFRNWESDEQVTKFLRWPAHREIATSRKVLGEWIEQYEKKDFYQWAITIKEEGNEPIGTISVVDINERLDMVHIGYCIGSKWWHRGITSEAFAGIIPFFFEEVKVNRIEALHDPNNPNSGKVMEKCGLKYEGTLRQADYNNQGIVDACMYSLLAEEYFSGIKGGHFVDFAQIREIQDEAKQVSKIYDIFDEENRLIGSNAAQVEFLTTVHYIEQVLKPGGRILDIGAGTGRYSFYFAEQGYPVDALELSDNNVRVFREKLSQSAEQQALQLELRQGNALDLSAYDDDSFDVVLLFGPLYHLHQEADRQRCIAEAKRVCKPDGTIFVAFIGNDMIPLTEFGYDPGYFKGDSYDHDSFKVEDFPFVFFTLDQCRQMLKDGGLQITHEVASDGVSELLADRINTMDEESYQQYLKYHFYCCEKPEMLGHSNHFLFVGHK